MLPTKFRFIWPSGFGGEDFLKSANQKQELPVVAMFVNRSGQNEQSLERTFHRCFLPSFSSFGWEVSEEKIKMWKVNGRWTTDAKWWQKLTLPLARWAIKGENTNIIKLQKNNLFGYWFSTISETDQSYFCQNFWMNVWRSFIVHIYSAAIITIMFTLQLLHSPIHSRN